jgi:uncharacterized phage protein gp47/JayE
MTDTTLLVKDGGGSSQALAAQANAGGSLTPYHVEDAAQRAALIAAIQAPSAGSAGRDYSAGAPAVPGVGAAFGAGLYAGYVQVAARAANPARANIDVENCTGAAILVVRDDGTAATGAAPANASVFALAGGAAPGAQGGAWSSTTFKGRLQIYAPTALSGGAFVTVMED